MSIPPLVKEMTTELKHNFEKRSRLISHPGESGDVSEIALRQILSTYLPNRCGVDSGFVVDSDWNESNQIDIVIYDKNYSPVFEIIDEKRFFPCETVIAVGEIKKSIDSKDKLKDAFSKIDSVKELNRAGARMITGPGMNLVGDRISEDDYRDQIWGFIFTADSLTYGNFIQEYLDLLGQRERNIWPNYYCDYNNFNIGYDRWEGDLEPTEHPVSELEDPEFGKQISRTLTDNQMSADGLYIYDNKELLFGLFHALLSDFVARAHIGVPFMYDYYNVGEFSHYRKSLQRLSSDQHEEE